MRKKISEGLNDKHILLNRKSIFVTANQPVYLFYYAYFN